jgi:hypothetical protein
LCVIQLGPGFPSLALWSSGFRGAYKNSGSWERRQARGGWPLGNVEGINTTQCWQIPIRCTGLKHTECSLCNKIFIRSSTFLFVLLFTLLDTKDKNYSFSLWNALESIQKRVILDGLYPWVLSEILPEQIHNFSLLNNDSRERNNLKTTEL